MKNFVLLLLVVIVLVSCLSDEYEVVREGFPEVKNLENTITTRNENAPITHYIIVGPFLLNGHAIGWGLQHSYLTPNQACNPNFIRQTGAPIEVNDLLGQSYYVYYSYTGSQAVIYDSGDILDPKLLNPGGFPSREEFCTPCQSRLNSVTASDYKIPEDPSSHYVEYFYDFPQGPKHFIETIPSTSNAVFGQCF